MVVDDSLSPRDIEYLAHHHVESLPGSMVSLFGDSYARAFYRYVANAPDEVVFIHREGVELSAACIVSLHPETLSKRLLFHTPLVLHLFGAAGRLPLRAMIGGSGAAGPRQPEGPEIILIFTTPMLRGRGVGKRLLTRCEELLTARHAGGIVVKTQDHPDNRAIAFYKKAGYTQVGVLSKHRKRLAVFSKSLKASNAA